MNIKLTNYFQQLLLGLLLSPKQIYLRALLILLILANYSSFAQTTFTPNPSGYTNVPSFGNVTYGGETYYAVVSPDTYIEAKAVDNGNNTVTFYVKKNSGTFNNQATFYVIKDPRFSGSNLTNLNKVSSNGTIAKGKSEGSITITPGYTSGSHTYSVILETTYKFYTEPIQLTAYTPSLPAKPDASTFSSSNESYSSFRGHWDAVSGATSYVVNIKEAIYDGSDAYSNHLLYQRTTKNNYYDFTGLKGNAYQFQVRAVNSYGNSDWSSSSDIIKTLSDLKIVGGNSFGTSTLEKGKSYTYSVKIKNNASVDWFGSFYLKGNGDQWEWNKITIKAGATEEYTKTITFNDTGSRTLTLYAQTGARGGQNFVVKTNGSYNNPFQFTVSTSTGGDTELEQAVTYLSQRNIIEGSTVSAANTSNPLLRQHLAKMAFYGAYGSESAVPSTVPSDNYPSVYDLNVGTYYYRAVKALLYLEYGDGVTPFDRNRLTFDPTEEMPRIHVLKALMEAFNQQPDMSSTSLSFTDLSSLDNQPRLKGYLRKAVSLGIVNTTNTTFRPSAICTRGEAILFLYRLMNKVGIPKPGDTDYFQPLNTTMKTISLGASLPMGNFQHYTKTSFTLDGVVPLNFTHAYNSYNTTLPGMFFGESSAREAYLPLADGWTHTYHTFITKVDDNVIVHWGGGSIDVYAKSGSTWEPVSMGVYDKLTQSGNTYTIKTKSQVTYTFGKYYAGVSYLTKVVDRNNNTLTVNYETGQNSEPRISTVSDGNGRKLTFSYKSGTNLLESVSDPQIRRSISFEYEANKATGGYRLCSFTDAKNQTADYKYASNTWVSTSKLLTQIKLPNGNIINNTYNDKNYRLTQTKNGDSKTTISVTSNYGSSVSTNSEVKVSRANGTSTYNYAYNANNVMTSMTGPESMSVSVTPYNTTGKLHLPKTITTNNTNISNIEYDGNGNVTRVDVTGDGKTLTTKYEYNTLNDITKMTDPMGNVTTYSYTNGNLTKIQSPISGVYTSIARNGNGTPSKVTDGEGVSVTYGYDSYGNLNKITLPGSLVTVPAFDAAGRLTSITDALGNTYTYGYDANDNMISEKDPSNNTTAYGYDANDNLTKITNAKGDETKLTYDNATDWLKSVTFAGATKRYDYNDDGTLDTYTKPDGTRLNYSYDDLGRVTNDGLNDYVYDNKQRLSSISGNGKTLSFTYDGFNRITRTSFDGHTNSYGYDKNGNCTSINNTTYSYDGMNRLTTVTFSNKTISYTYRNDSQLSKVTYPNGMTTTFGYDTAGRLTSKATKLSNGTVIASYSYTLDKVGNITKQTTQEPYDNISLVNEDVSYTYNSGNRITKAGDISFSFDANGNTTKRGSELYSWDESDRLTRAGSTNIEYDPLGLIASYGDITFTTDPLGIGNVLSDSKSGATYIYGNGLEARVKNGAISYYVTDVRGSVVAIVDGSGNITHKYQYDEFGKVVQKQEADYNPFQYVGKYGVMYLNDHQYYMRARHYDPTIGRFLSEDPIWSTNLYPYADNDPIMGIDPEGLSCKKKYNKAVKAANAVIELNDEGKLYDSGELTKKGQKKVKKLKKKLNNYAESCMQGNYTLPSDYVATFSNSTWNELRSDYEYGQYLNAAETVQTNKIRTNYYGDAVSGYYGMCVAGTSLGGCKKRELIE